MPESAVHAAFRLDVAATPSGTLVTPLGEVDADVSARLRDALEEAVRSGPVVLDLSGVTFLDSAGLSALLRARRVGAEVGHRFLVTGTPPPVMRVLAATGLHRVLELDPPCA